MAKKFPGGLHGWYLRLRTKDLGPTRRDWQDYLKEKAKWNHHNATSLFNQRDSNEDTSLESTNDEDCESESDQPEEDDVEYSSHCRINRDLEMYGRTEVEGEEDQLIVEEGRNCEKKLEEYKSESDQLEEDDVEYSSQCRINRDLEMHGRTEVEGEEDQLIVEEGRNCEKRLDEYIQPPGITDGITETERREDEIMVEESKTTVEENLQYLDTRTEDVTEIEGIEDEIIVEESKKIKTTVEESLQYSDTRTDDATEIEGLEDEIIVEEGRKFEGALEENIQSPGTRMDDVTETEGREDEIIVEEGRKYENALEGKMQSPNMRTDNMNEIAREEEEMIVEQVKKCEKTSEEKIQYPTISTTVDMPLEEPKSPFSMYLNRSFPSPTLVLPEDGSRVLEESRDSSLYSPTLQISDMFSPGRSAVNTTREVAASLVSNFNDSATSWSSALFTPTAGMPPVPHHSTIERLTLHPRQELRRTVLARRLFTPCTPRVGISSPGSNQHSPGLGIISCHTPVLGFSERMATTSPEREDREPYADDFSEVACLQNVTQGFSVGSGGARKDSTENFDLREIVEDDTQGLRVSTDVARKGSIECIDFKENMEDDTQGFRMGTDGARKDSTEHINLREIIEDDTHGFRVGTDGARKECVENFCLRENMKSLAADTECNTCHSIELTNSEKVGRSIPSAAEEQIRLEKLEGINPRSRFGSPDFRASVPPASTSTPVSTLAKSSLHVRHLAFHSKSLDSPIRTRVTGGAEEDESKNACTNSGKTESTVDKNKNYVLTEDPLDIVCSPVHIVKSFQEDEGKTTCNVQPLQDKPGKSTISPQSFQDNQEKSTCNVKFIKDSLRESNAQSIQDNIKRSFSNVPPIRDINKDSVTIDSLDDCASITVLSDFEVLNFEKVTNNDPGSKCKCNQVSDCDPVANQNSDTDALQIIPLKSKPLAEMIHSCLTENKSEIKDIKRNSCQCGKNQSSFFTRVDSTRPSMLKQEAWTGSSAETSTQIQEREKDTTSKIQGGEKDRTTTPKDTSSKSQEGQKVSSSEVLRGIGSLESQQEQPANILQKLSLQKKKRNSSKFLYPFSSGKTYEKLNIKYTERLVGDDTNKDNQTKETADTNRENHNKETILDTLDPLVRGETQENSGAGFIDTVNKHNRHDSFFPLSDLKNDQEFSGSIRAEGASSSLSSGKDTSNHKVPIAPQSDKICTEPHGNRRKSLETQGSEDVIARNLNENSADHKSLQNTSFLVHNRQEFRNEMSRKEGSDISLRIQNREETGNERNKKESLTVLHDLQVVPEQNPDDPSVNSPALQPAIETRKLPTSQSQKQSYSQWMNDSFSDMDFSVLDTTINAVEERANTGTSDIRKGEIKAQNPHSAVLSQIDTADENDMNSREAVADDDVRKTGVVEESGFFSFCTGTGKKVRVSDEALKSARKLLEEPVDEENNDVGKMEKQESGFSGFRTGTGKKMRVSDESLKHAKKLLEDLPDEESTILPRMEMDAVNQSDEKFNNETQKDVRLSNVFSPVLTDSEQSREAVDSPHSTVSRSTLDHILNSLKVPVSSKLASEENVVSPQTKSPSPSIFVGKEFAEKSGSFCGDSGMPVFQGFKTGRGATVKVKESSLQRAQRLWKEETEAASTSKETKGPDSVRNPKQTATSLNSRTGLNMRDDLTVNETDTFPGFSTAAGSKVIIREEALTRAQDLWKECQGISHTGSSPVLSGERETQGQILNKESIISPVYCRSKRKERESDLSPVHSRYPLRMPAVPDVESKRKEGENEVTADDKDLAAVEVQSDDSRSISVQATPRNTTPEGRKWPVSEEVTEKTMTDSSGEVTSMGGFPCFSAALGKKIKISEDALMKSRKLLSEDLTEEDFMESDFEEGEEMNTMLETLNKTNRSSNAPKTSVDYGEETNGLERTGKIFRESGGEEADQVGGYAGSKTDNNHNPDILPSTSRKSSSKLEQVDTPGEAGKEGDGPSLLPSKFKGFSTAAGGKVVLKESSLMKAKALFEDIDDQAIPEAHPITERPILKVHTSTDQATVSSSCTDKGLNMCGKLGPVESDLVGMCSNSIDGQVKSSQTQNSVKIAHVSETQNKSLTPLKSKSELVTENVKTTVREGVMEKRISKSEFKSNKDINTEDSMEVGRGLSSGSRISSFGGFISGRGKKANISKQALEQARKMFGEDPDEFGPHTENKRSGAEEKTVVCESKSTDIDTQAADSNNCPADCLAENTYFEPRSLVAENSQDESRSPSPILGSQVIKEKPFKFDQQSLGRFGLSTLPKERFSSSLDYQRSKPCDQEPVSRSLPVIKVGDDVESSPQTPESPQQDCSPVLSRSQTVSPKLNRYFRSQNKNTCRGRAIHTSTQEISDISEITEAFLNDDPWDQVMTAGSGTSQRKRQRDSTDTQTEEVTDSTTLSKKQRTDTETARCEEVSEAEAARELIRAKQTRIIQYKEKQKQSVQPMAGSLYKIRQGNKANRLKLKSLGGPKVYQEVQRDILHIHPSNAMRYKFSLDDSRCEVVECSDGCSIVPDIDGCIGVEEVERGFLASPGVHPQLLHPSWVCNQYKWIIWQLAALERNLIHKPFLTLENVVARLKYRYDREIDRAQRPILRKVTEQDDAPQKTMVLCVAAVMPEFKVQGSSAVRGDNIMLEVTDGWYSIGCICDGAMRRQVELGKVVVGTKLLIHGAELTGSHHPCHPLEAPSTLRLRVHTNLCRRVRWWVRLGLLPQTGSIPTYLAAVQGNGGLVGKVEVCLARVYPLVYFERMEGRAVFRGEKAHMRKLRETEKLKETTVNRIVAEVEREVSEEGKKTAKKEKVTMTKDEIRNLTLGQDIARLMENTMDPAELEGLLTSEQVQLAHMWQQRQAEERRRRVNTEVQHRLSKKTTLYEPAPLLKVRAVDSEGTDAIITIWRPTEDLIEALTEGSFFTVQYLLASEYRRGSLQLTTTRQSKWENIPPNFLFKHHRFVTPLCLTSGAELNPVWREMDVAGVVLRVGLFTGLPQLVQIIDHHANILTLKFWESVRESGYEDTVVVGSVIGVMNGSWRGHSSERFGSVHITELTTITTTPRSPHLTEAISHLKNSIKDMKKLLHEGDMKLDRQYDSRAFANLQETAGGRQRNDSTETADTESKEAANVSNPEGGENECASKSSDDIESKIMSAPKLSRPEQRKREVHKKLTVLNQYGMGSFLSNIHSPASESARKPFRVPYKQQ